jgi:hypothetical protein
MEMEIGNMTLQPKIIEKEVEGKTIGFRFNMLSIGKACKIEKCSVSELYKRLGMTIKDGLQEQPTDLETLTNYFYAAAIVYKEGKGEKVDFNPVDVSDWLEYFDVNELLLVAFNAPDIKNQTAPIQSGQ